MSVPADPTATAANPPSTSDRLRNVCVAVREDLEVSRHLFRNRPAYIVRDPLTLQSHRLDPADYRVFVAVDHSRTLGEIFDELVTEGTMTQEDEERFYAFIVALHRLNFLSLPIADEKLLYRRHLARKKARRAQKRFAFLFFPVPLVNPDAFLERTVVYARHLFTPWFFALWTVLIGAAGFVALQNAHDLFQPLQGVLAARNLPLMWITLIGLKVLHEFGHAYACKHYGGYVPEMGAYFILFTPCAYVDATASWGFARKRHRLIVCLAGMYVEVIFAALAMFVWAATGPGLVHDVAYNVIFLAGLVTILFNVNPLMRYDGYYVLSDLVEIPNLRQRSRQAVLALAKRIVLGIKTDRGAGDARERLVLVSFGLATTVYRFSVTLAIGALIASKMFYIGMILSIGYVGNVVVSVVRRLIRYLWRAEETAPVRGRAVAVGVTVLVALPAAILFIPIRSTVYAGGTLGRREEVVIRSRVDGYVEQVQVEPGKAVAPGDVLVELRNDTYGEAVARARAQVQASVIRQNAYEATDPAAAFAEQVEQGAYRRNLARREADVADLVMRARAHGRVVKCLHPGETGRFLHIGEPVAMVARGSWEVRCLLTEDQMADCQPAVGDSVDVRTAAGPGRTLPGRIIRITPAGSRAIHAESLSLSHLGGGDIAVNPNTREAAQPYFELAIEVPDSRATALRHGMTCRVRFDTGAEPIGIGLFRRLLRFTDSLLKR